MKKKKKINFKQKLKDILNSYKTIIYISFLINIILLIFTYHTVSSYKVYTFSGSDDYIRVSDGIISFSTDINLLNGNNIEYINGVDYDIKEYEIGYYVMDDTKLIEIISSKKEIEENIKLSEVIKNFVSLNIVEKNSKSHYFTQYKKKLLDNGLYLVLKAKKIDGEDILCKVKLNMSKISKF